MKCLIINVIIAGDLPGVIAIHFDDFREIIIDGIKGEIVLIIDGNKDDYRKDVDYGTLMNMVNSQVMQGLSKSDAVKKVAGETGISRKKLYDLVHSKEN